MCEERETVDMNRVLELEENPDCPLPDREEELQIWNKRCDAIDAKQAALPSVESIRRNEVAIGYILGDYRDAVRDFIEAMEPYLKDDSLEGATEAWEKVELYIRDGYEYIGLRSILHSEPDAKIPHEALRQAIRVGRAFMWCHLIGDLKYEAFGLDPEDFE